MRTRIIGAGLALCLCVAPVFAQASDGTLPESTDYMCAVKVAKALEGMRSPGTVDIEGCGSLEHSVVQSTAPSVMASKRPCYQTKYVNLYGVTTLLVQTCVSFSYDGQAITYFENPPTVICAASYPWKCLSTSSGGQWITQPTTARIWSSTLAEQTLVGYPLFTITVTHEATLDANGGNLWDVYPASVPPHSVQ